MADLYSLLASAQAEHVNAHGPECGIAAGQPADVCVMVFRAWARTFPREANALHARRFRRDHPRYDRRGEDPAFLARRAEHERIRRAELDDAERARWADRDSHRHRAKRLVDPDHVRTLERERHGRARARRATDPVALADWKARQAANLRARRRRVDGSCSEAECPRGAYAKGLCEAHYARRRRIVTVAISNGVA